MRNDNVKSPEAENIPCLQPEIDYAPKICTLQEQILFGVKMVTVGGIIFLMLWLFEKYAA